MKSCKIRASVLAAGCHSIEYLGDIFVKQMGTGTQKLTSKLNQAIDVLVREVED